MFGKLKLEIQIRVIFYDLNLGIWLHTIHKDMDLDVMLSFKSLTGRIVHNFQRLKSY